MSDAQRIATAPIDPRVLFHSLFRLDYQRNIRIGIRATLLQAVRIDWLVLCYTIMDDIAHNVGNVSAHFLGQYEESSTLGRNREEQL